MYRSRIQHIYKHNYSIIRIRSHWKHTQTEVKSMMQAMCDTTHKRVISCSESRLTCVRDWRWDRRGGFDGDVSSFSSSSCSSFFWRVFSWHITALSASAPSFLCSGEGRQQQCPLCPQSCPAPTPPTSGSRLNAQVRVVGELCPFKRSGIQSTIRASSQVTSSTKTVSQSLPPTLPSLVAIDNPMTHLLDIKCRTRQPNDQTPD